MSYLVTQIERAADILAPVDGEHWKQLLAGDWMATDATGLKVLVPKLGCHHGHIEVHRRDDVAVFQCEPHTMNGRTPSIVLRRAEPAALGTAACSVANLAIGDRHIRS